MTSNVCCIPLDAKLIMLDFVTKIIVQKSRPKSMQDTMQFMFL